MVSGMHSVTCIGAFALVAVWRNGISGGRSPFDGAVGQHVVDDQDVIARGLSDRKGLTL
jgi:hypothetical protein